MLSLFRLLTDHDVSFTELKAFELAISALSLASLAMTFQVWTYGASTARAISESDVNKEFEAAFFKRSC